MLKIIKGFFASIGAVFRFWLWIRRILKNLEAETKVRFSVERAALIGRHLRLNCERIIKRLGDGDLTQLPPIVRWIFARTTLDNTMRQFLRALLQSFLKSGKLEREDPALAEPIDPYPCH